jgi:hypothetical protein
MWVLNGQAPARDFMVKVRGSAYGQLTVGISMVKIVRVLDGFFLFVFCAPKIIF